MTSHESSNSGTSEVIPESIHEESALSRIPPLPEVVESSTPAAEGVIENGKVTRKRVELVGTNEGLPDYVEVLGDAGKIERYQKDIKTVKEKGMKELVDWFENANKFTKLLLEGGIITEAQLNSTRMYHVLIGSTPLGGKVESFDLPGGVIERFIKSQLEKSLIVVPQQDPANTDSQA